MEKQLKDYLHLYLGCECKTSEGTGILIKVGDPQSGEDCEVSIENDDIESGFYGEWTDYNFEHHKIKPILRPLSSMTQEERIELWNMIFWFKFPNNGHSKRFDREITRCESRWVLSAGVERMGIEDNGEVWADSDLSPYKHNQHEVTRWFLSKHFDVFNLIEDGLAIDATTLQKEADNGL